MCRVGPNCAGPCARTCFHRFNDYVCGGGRYYLDVAPTPGDVTLGASAGDVPDADSEPVTKSPAETATKVAENLTFLVGIGLAIDALLAAPPAPPTAHELELKAER